MTGFGEGHTQRDGLAVSVELRCINSRYLKLSTRLSEGYGSLEPQIEAVVRKSIRRGTIQVNVRIDRAKQPEDFRINSDVLESYRRQIKAIQDEWEISRPVLPESLLLLPGVVGDAAEQVNDAATAWPQVQETLSAAIDNLGKMRAEEGRVMAEDLKANCRALAASLDEVRRRAPLVAEGYRTRLSERLNKVLAEHNAALDPIDILKEVSLFTDRSDISEEVVRLQSHVDQFETIMEARQSSGRKLEFLTQEMVREGNTIGSKANDVEISRYVIEIKTAVERIREMIQNVE
jgi:uncharacterized protein (TIGR00255 family)